MKLTKLDHIVLTVKDISKSCQFYQNALSMDVQTFENNTRTALYFANTKINLHEVHHEFEPKAKNPTPGSADICLITTTPISQVITELQEKNILIEEGPTEKTGANGSILSIYLRDPDCNLIEISNYI